MSSDLSSAVQSNKRQRIMIVIEDDYISDDIENNNHVNLLKQIFSQSHGKSSMVMNTQNSTQILVKRSKPRDSSLICVICGSSAHGCNFDAIACESCKAFFRRNARKDRNTLSCKSNSTCQITAQTRRYCVACRLKKCFNHGMQPDRVSKNKQNPSTHIRVEENRSSRSNLNFQENDQELQISSPTFFDDLFTSPETDILTMNFSDLPLSHSQQTSFTSEDLKRLENVSLTYQKRIELAASDSLHTNPTIGRETFLETLNSQSIFILRLLSFFKQIPEFNQLDTDDKVKLIKYNLPLILGMNASLSYNTETHQILESPFDIPVNIQHFRILHGYKTCMRSGKIFFSFLHMAKFDRTILEIALIILILTAGFSVINHGRECTLNNEISVYHAQNCYTHLLWKYLEVKYGCDKAIRLFSQLIGDIVSWQIVYDDMRNDVLRTLSPEDINELVPLLKPFLYIS